MLIRLLPLLAVVSATPLVPRQQDVASSSSVSSALPSSAAASASGTTASSIDVSALSSAVPLPLPTSSNGTGIGGSDPPPPSVTMYPSTSGGEPIVVNGQRSQVVPVDSYLGVPFAEPPVGELRFVPPQDASYNSTVEAVTQPPACLQSPNAISGSNYSEDCLYLNVFTPAGANAQTAFLPVMVWIHGGSFTAGGAEVYDGSGIITTSSIAEKPVILVVIQYRLGILGFGYGDEIASNGAANLGLKDQIKALEWVQQNIWAWGGDPDRVTVAGQSAGAISISLMYLQQDLNLFRGAIMQSGAQSTAPIGPTDSSWQRPLDLVLSLLGCEGNSTSDNSTESSGSSGLSGFECLKAAPADQLVSAQEAAINASNGAFIFAPSIDGDLIPSSPHTLLEQGQFARIPFISGNVKDEGTLFTPEAINNQTAIAGLIIALSPRAPPTDIIAQAISLYPSDPAAGSPFDTGNETFGLDPAWKRAAAILGDAQFQAQRRWFLQQANQYGLDQTWSYQFEQYPSVGDRPERLGVYHGADVLFTFGAPILGLGGNWSEADQVLSATMLDYWTSFVNYLDPNQALVLPNATSWPTYAENVDAGGSGNMLRLLAGNITVFPDDYRDEMGYFLTEPEAFNQRKKRDQGGE